MELREYVDKATEDFESARAEERRKSAVVVL